LKLSEVEGKLVKVNIWWNVADLAAIDSDLISQHAWSWDLNGIWPVVIIVAERIGEVQNGVLWNEGGILCNIEMSWLNSTLGNWMRHKEEVKATFNDLWLLNKTVINISSLRRVQDVSGVRAWMIGRFLEEPLSHTLIDDDECGMGESVALSFRVVFVSHNLFQLIKLVIDDFLAHWIANTVTINENMIRERTTIVLTISLKGTTEIILENVGRNNLLSLLALRAGLGVIFAHILVICCYEADNALLALVAHIDTYEHCLVGDFLAKVHAPKISS
jgi:hypothetical protein